MAKALKTPWSFLLYIYISTNKDSDCIRFIPPKRTPKVQCSLVEELTCRRRCSCLLQISAILALSTLLFFLGGGVDLPAANFNSLITNHYYVRASGYINFRNVFHQTKTIKYPYNKTAVFNFCECAQYDVCIYQSIDTWLLDANVFCTRTEANLIIKSISDWW